MTGIHDTLLKRIKTESLVNAKTTLVSFYQKKNNQSLHVKCTRRAHPKQECSQSTATPISLQPSFRHARHVSRFNPTVPYPEANRILSQSIMLIAKELVCP